MTTNITVLAKIVKDLDYKKENTLFPAPMDIRSLSSLTKNVGYETLYTFSSSTVMKPGEYIYAQDEGRFYKINLVSQDTNGDLVYLIDKVIRTD